MSNNQLDKLHEFDFWSMIKNLNWGDNTLHCLAARQYIMKNFPPYKVNAFRRIADTYATKLIESYESTVKSIFSISEIYNGAMEVVGFGKAEFERYIKDPILLSGIIESLIEKEEDNKFVYALPFEDDYFNKETIV
jgi:hypothetical protein